MVCEFYEHATKIFYKYMNFCKCIQYTYNIDGRMENPHLGIHSVYLYFYRSIANNMKQFYFQITRW